MIKVLVFAAALLGVDGTSEEWPANTGVTHVVEEVQIGDRIIVIEQTHPDPNGPFAEIRKKRPPRPEKEISDELRAHLARGAYRAWDKCFEGKERKSEVSVRPDPVVNSWGGAIAFRVTQPPKEGQRLTVDTAITDFSDVKLSSYGDVRRFLLAPFKKGKLKCAP